jgi:hypothetical protein
MDVRQLLRPRILAGIFGGHVLVIAVISVWFANGPGYFYQYGATVSEWVYAVYLLLAAVLLSVIGVVAAGSLRHLGDLILDVETKAEVERDTGERGPEDLGAMEYEGLPLPVLEGSRDEDPMGVDPVDHDIDELLEALGAIETSAEEEEGIAVVEVPKPPELVPVSVSKSRPRSVQMLESWKKRRAAVAAYFAGPALILIGIIGACAIVLPGADGFLQGHAQFNTALMLGIAYSYWGIALYTGLSVYAILTHR